jgi:hypothetical protein
MIIPSFVISPITLARAGRVTPNLICYFLLRIRYGKREIVVLLADIQKITSKIASLWF